jgi:hypothetical protein
MCGLAPGTRYKSRIDDISLRFVVIIFLKSPFVVTRLGKIKILTKRLRNKPRPLARVV